MNRFVTIVVTSCLGLILAAAVAAQPEEEDDFTFAEVIDVQLVNVEAWVTDKSGRSVTGLTVDDFELLEDGEPVEITYFSEVREAVRVLTGAPPLPGEAPQTAEAETAPADPSHLILYFDQLHLTPSSQKRVLKDIRDFLTTERVPPERILILRQGQTMTTEATFGSSWVEIDDALERMENSRPPGGLMSADKRLAVRALQDLWDWAEEVAGLSPTGDSAEAACSLFVPRANSDIETYAAQSRQRIRVTLEHLASVSSFLTGVPGLKTMIYVSDALERAPGSDLIQFVNDRCPVRTDTPLFLLSDELSREFRTLTRHANANRITVYSLQAQGLTSGFLTSASERTVELRGIASFDVALRTSEREGLSVLAAETGGRMIINTNDFGDDLVDIANEMSSYYSLGYEPLHGGDEAEHEIRVKIKNKDLRVRHRQGYRDKSADVRMTERLQGAVYLGLVDNPLGVRLAAGSVTPGEKNRLLVPLHVLVPSEKIVFLPRDQGVTAQLSVQVSTRNTVDQKGIFDHRAYRVNWSTDSDQEMVNLVMNLEVPPGVHLVAVGVRDDATHDMSFVSTTIEVHSVPATEGAGP
jgi:VWFA-related protein